MPLGAALTQVSASEYQKLIENGSVTIAAFKGESRPSKVINVLNHDASHEAEAQVISVQAVPSDDRYESVTLKLVATLY